MIDPPPRSIIAGTAYLAWDGRTLLLDMGEGALEVVDRTYQPAHREDEELGGEILAPMSGKVIAVNVAEGAAVLADAVVIVLEAMKMQHQLSAQVDGTVAQLRVRPGEQVAARDVLAVVNPTPDETSG